MKKLVWALLVVMILPCPVMAGVKAFRDLSFGDPLSKLIKCELRSKAGPVSYYWRKGDVTSLGTIPVAEVEYGFYKNKLFQVRVDIPKSYPDLRDHLEWDKPGLRVELYSSSSWQSGKNGLRCYFLIIDPALKDEAEKAISAEIEKSQKKQAESNASTW